MATIKMKYGKEKIDVSISDDNLLGVIKSKGGDGNSSEEDIIKDALKNPIASARLKKLVKPGERICIVISDITRAWQKMSAYLPYLVQELNDGGINDEDIIFLSATGSHRKQTKEEHEVLLGKELAKRFKVIDHVSTDKDSLVHLGDTSYGTPVMVNKLALECDHVVLTGAIVFHLLAGWGGGKKSVLPGICGYETIMANHALSLNPELGSGSNPLVRSGNIDGNPIHLDMLEATSFVRPTFLFNAIMDSNGNIAHAVAGNYIKAHEAGCEIVDKKDGVMIEEKGDMVIATAGGYPKDINLYQTSKTLINAKEAVKEGGTIIILSQCSEGFGNKPIEDMIRNYTSVLDREKALREDYSIAKYIGYFFAETADKFDLILVSDMDKALLESANITVVDNLDDALKITYDKKGKDLKTYLMPNGANTLPKLK
ncbi:nickel-dependent lactate racemase [Clostridiisalibacter paucivorans]|uniref:nickel-dependent lactate racemase n=1 Tax=Clostridiisalibacter paucivorans TaxID=408753 RepID=UPI00047B8D5B|nr:nickel-dependent lactate racemase [Clostridiisalibacter paucivorans]